MTSNKKNPYRTFEPEPIKATVKDKKNQPKSEKTVLKSSRGRRVG